MDSKLIVIAVALVAGGCNRPVELTTPDQTTSLQEPKESVQSTLLAPPAPAERGPIPPDANAAAPGTNASLAFTNSAAEAAKLPENRSKCWFVNLQLCNRSTSDHQKNNVGAAFRLPDLICPGKADPAGSSRGPYNYSAKWFLPNLIRS